MLSAVFRHHSNLISRTNGSDVHVLHLEWEKEMLVISGHAKNVWLSLDGRRSVESILLTLSKDVSPSFRDRFRCDVLTFLAEMEEQQLIVRLPQVG